MTRFKGFLALGLIVSATCGAAVPEPVQKAPAVAPTVCDLNIGTGPAGKGYSKFYANFKAVCTGVNICERTTAGGLQNLDLLQQKQVDLGLTGANTVKSMMTTDPGTIGQFEVVASFHSNLLHPLVRADGYIVSEKKTEARTVGGVAIPMTSREISVTNTKVIAKFSDLRDLPVGLVGSAQLLGQNINKIAGLNMQLFNFSSDKEAIEALKANKIAGVLTMAAWPIGDAVGALKQSDGFRFVDYDLAPFSPLNTVKKNYSQMGQFGVMFLAEPNILVARSFTVGGPNWQNISKLKTCIASNLATFKDGKFEPGWNDVTDLNKTYDLKPFATIIKK